VRVKFNKVSIGKRKRRWKEDGKWRQETREFWQTINPFNRNDDGTPKDRLQILAELNAEAAVWMHAKELAATFDRGGKP
jgi:hypothetical protein